jgi:hypothetical protein
MVFLGASRNEHDTINRPSVDIVLPLAMSRLVLPVRSKRPSGPGYVKNRSDITLSVAPVSGMALILTFSGRPKLKSIGRSNSLPSRLKGLINCCSEGGGPGGGCAVPKGEENRDGVVLPEEEEEEDRGDVVPPEGGGGGGGGAAPTEENRNDVVPPEGRGEGKGDAAPLDGSLLV